MNRPDILLDMHTHLIFPNNLCDFEGISTEGGTIEIDKAPLEAAALLQPDTLLAWLDTHRIHRAWISAPPPVFRPQLPEDAAYSWAKALTDGLHTIAGRYADRLTALGFLPVEHPAAAAALVQESESLRRFAMSTGGRGVVLSDPIYEPLWQALNAKKAVLFLHPGRGVDARLAKFYLRNLLGNPSETALAAAHLVLAGIVEKYSQITFILSHGGGTVPTIAGRWQYAYDEHCHDINTSIAPPMEQLRRLWVDCVTHGPTGLTAALDVFGQNHVVFGSDWPFPMGTLAPEPGLDKLPADVAVLILQTNPQKLEAL